MHPPRSLAGLVRRTALVTLLGMPAVTLPLMQGANGLPLGVQLVGRRNFDARLLRTARWLEAKLASS